MQTQTLKVFNLDPSARPGTSQFGHFQLKALPRLLTCSHAFVSKRFTPKRFECDQVLARATAAAAPSEASKPDVDHIKMVLDELANHRKVCIAQTAPAVRVSIGEELGLPPGTQATGKLVASLKTLGFDYVFDVLAGADLTIMEEGTELLHRLRDNLEGKQGAPPLPMFTSCCPGWIEFVEKCVPEIIPYVSTCKSPHMMSGAIIKNWFAEKLNVPAQDVCVVSIMPCVRKQGEADRIWYHTPSGARDVDHVLTTRDLGQLLRDKGIDFGALSDDTRYDNFLGIGTGAAALFGTTGGVMEAALRTVYELVSGRPMEPPKYEPLRGVEGLKEATVVIPANAQGPLHNAEPITINIAVANGLGSAKKLLKDIEDGTSKYHFIEVMACPGGCVGGGGQPRSQLKDIVKIRQGALYGVDERATLRRSHENPVVQTLYNQFLGEPGSPKAHKLLHTQYVECGPPKFDITKPGAPVEEGVCYESDVCDALSDEEGQGARAHVDVDATGCYGAHNLI